MYNVPGVPPRGASAFSGGHLRRHAITINDLAQCQSGGSLTS
jgi:hypothetical protein